MNSFKKCIKLARLKIDIIREGDFGQFSGIKEGSILPIKQGYKIQKGTCLPIRR